MALNVRPDWSEVFERLVKVAKEVHFCLSDYILLTNGPLNHTNFSPEVDINLIKKGIVGLMLHGAATICVDEKVSPGSMLVVWPIVGQRHRTKVYDILQLNELAYH